MSELASESSMQREPASEPSAQREPRIPAIPLKQWPPEMRTAMKALNVENPRHPYPRTDDGRPKGLNILGTFANHTEMLIAFHKFNAHVLFTTTLSIRQRELLVLRIAHVRDCEYEWTQHVVQALDAGITPAEINRVAEGPAADGWDPLEGALVAATDELVAHAMITDDTWAGLAEELDQKQILDVIFTVGLYDTLAMGLRSCRIELDADLKTYVAGLGLALVTEN